MLFFYNKVIESMQLSLACILMIVFECDLPILEAIDRTIGYAICFLNSKYEFGKNLRLFGITEKNCFDARLRLWSSGLYVVKLPGDIFMFKTSK